MSCEIDIEVFKGPLDLLLHLIKKHEMDIYDIPIAEITAQYLAALDAMQTLNLEVAGEFLVMAATLLHIKSRLLLPRDPDPDPEEDEIDPRAELVHRLLEYQKYREAAADLDRRAILGRDVFVRCFVERELAEPEEAGLQPVGIFELAEALRQLACEAPEPLVHEVARERLSVAERIQQLLELLTGKPAVPFAELPFGDGRREERVVTFLAVLEMVKLQMVSIMQNRRCGTLWLRAVAKPSVLNAPLQDDAFGYC
jgi:segregation and condensation protein A